MRICRAIQLRHEVEEMWSKKDIYYQRKINSTNRTRRLKRLTSGMTEMTSIFLFLWMPSSSAPFYRDALGMVLFHIRILDPRLGV